MKKIYVNIVNYENHFRLETESLVPHIQLNVCFHENNKITYMDSYTKEGNILDNFRLGMLISILNHKNLYSLSWHTIQKLK